MQLRRALPLSLVALLASAGCVSVGPQDPAAVPSPVRGAVPAADTPERAAPPALPLGELPATVPPGASRDTARGAAADPDRDRAAVPARPRERPRAKQAAPPRRARVSGAATAHPRRRPAPPPPRLDELCAAADGVVPPSIVDLCLRQYDR
ncbi:hypothetical protein [Streptomyces sp. A0592]|uniref:hypothetical protein n=1 Tax=Streptomyces sp. A0592 TaxID=2563099 RepID=UPI00109E8170|nr:hypothetical protein [Streptomyces sp. A0592]THA86057.1 hypothetical protein E6U81_03335 [Streptomyces sp. A0592]